MAIIFGVGKNGKKALEMIGPNEVECYVDNDIRLQGDNYRGKEIYSVNYLSGASDATVIISPYGRDEEILKQLQQYPGIKTCFLSGYTIEEQFKNKQGNIVLMNTHEGINIGDYLINVAERYFIKRFFSGCIPAEIPAGIFMREESCVKRHVHDDDIILISGGGYMGNLWMEKGENNIRKIIEDFPNNKIIILPQTIYFENTSSAENEAHISQKIYNAHKNLCICTRDKKSYELSKQLFDGFIAKVYMPDMSMILNESYDTYRRNGVLICFRNDKERILKERIEDDIYSIIELYGKVDVSTLDMNCDDIHYYDYQIEYVDKILKRIKKSKLVITDRLHCMLSCLITGTPCIAFDNKTGKVSGVYEWIRECDYIRIVDQKADISMLIEKYLSNNHTYYYKHDNMMTHYTELAKLIGT